MNATFTRITSPILIPDLQTGLQMLARLPIANAPQAEADLDRFFSSMLEAPPPADVYLKLLEQARVPLCFVGEELAKRYINKPLPLATAEEDLFQRMVSTWRKAARAHRHCIQLDTSANDSERSLHTAQHLHRCIHYAGMVITEHHRARRELPPEVWIELHTDYAKAEALGVAALAVADPNAQTADSASCAAAFASLLLCELAGPYSLSVRDQNLVRRWANSWSSIVSIHLIGHGESPPDFAIDLKKDAGLHPTPKSSPIEHLRRLNTLLLTKQLAKIRQQLNQKIPPIQIGLGEDCTSGQCNRLLELLSRLWSQAKAPRKFDRHATSGTARLCTEFDAMHYFISGKEFVQPENVQAYSRQEFDRLFAFRHMVDPTQQLQVSQKKISFTVDYWEVVNQSANGFRLHRSVAGRKMTHGQLLSICPHDGEKFFLAHTTWLMQEQNGGLIAGVAALPGIPLAIAIRPVAEEKSNWEKCSPAFMLPTLRAVGSMQSLIIPKGWYRPGRILEIHAESKFCAQLKHVIDDGPDFEWVDFLPV